MSILLFGHFSPLHPISPNLIINTTISRIYIPIIFAISTARIEKFENNEAWKKAQELTRRIYEISSSDVFGRDFGLRDQIRRPALSTMSNVAEGFERDVIGSFAASCRTPRTKVVKSHLDSMWHWMSASLMRESFKTVQDSWSDDKQIPKDSVWYPNWHVPDKDG